MRRQDWLLLLLALRDASEPLDPVRLQKAMFLLARENDLPAAESYDFAPYDYGPFSVEIYRDLDELHVRGLVDRLEMPGYTWSRYRPTQQGIEQAQGLLDGMDPGQHRLAVYLHELKQGVLSLSFQELLQHVYSRYPEFREKSVFNG